MWMIIRFIVYLICCLLSTLTFLLMLCSPQNRIKSSMLIAPQSPPSSASRSRSQIAVKKSCWFGFWFGWQVVEENRQNISRSVFYYLWQPHNRKIMAVAVDESLPHDIYAVCNLPVMMRYVSYNENENFPCYISKNNKSHCGVGKLNNVAHSLTFYTHIHICKYYAATVTTNIPLSSPRNHQSKPRCK